MNADVPEWVLVSRNQVVAGFVFSENPWTDEKMYNGYAYYLLAGKWPAILGGPFLWVGARPMIGDAVNGTHEWASSPVADIRRGVELLRIHLQLAIGPYDEF